MKRLLKWLLLLSAVMVVVLTVIVLNPRLLKSPVEHYLSQLSGYSVRLDGALNLYPGRELTVQATDIHIINPGHEDQPQLAVLGSLQISLETASLFSAAIVLSQIHLDNALIALDTNDAGVSNWEKIQRSSPQHQPAGRGKSFNIRDIRISNSRLHYQQYETGKNQLLKISHFIQTEEQSGLLKVDLDGTFNDRPVSFDGHIGHVANIFEGRDISFDGRGQFGPIKIVGSGLIDDLIHPKQPGFDIKLFGPDIKEVTAMLKTDDLGTGAFDLKAHGQVSDGKYSAFIEGRIGDVVLHASALTNEPGNLDDLAVELDARGPKLGALTRAFGQQGWPDQPFSLKGKLDFAVKNIKQLQVSLKTSLAEARLSGSLGATAYSGDTRLHLSVHGPNAHKLLSIFEINALPATPFTLASDVHLLAASHAETRHVSLQNIKVGLAGITLSGNAAFDVGKRLHTGSGSLRIESRDIANLKQFPTLQTSADLLVSGQPFQLSGDLSVSSQIWTLHHLQGTIGSTNVAVEGVVKPLNGWAGSDIGFDIKGPGLHLLLNAIKPGSHLQEAFTSNGQLQISADTLKLSGFRFQSGNARLTLNGSTAWPIVHNPGFTFQIDSHGDDISRFIPAIEKFEPASVAFNLKVSGRQQQGRTAIDSLKASAGSLQLILDGNLQRKGEVQADAHIKLKSGNISALGRYDGKALPATGLTLQAAVHGSPGHVLFEQMQAQLGDSDLSGTLDISFSGIKPVIQLHSTSELVDLRAFLAPSRSKPGSGADHGGQHRLIPATRLPIDLLGQFDASIDADIKTVRSGSDTFKNVALNAHVKNGQLNLPELTLQGQRGTLTAALSIIPTETDQAVLNIDLRTDGFVLNSNVNSDSDLDKLPATDLVLHARGQGNTLRQIAGSATGRLQAGSEGGILAGFSLGILDEFLLNQVFSLILPKSRKNENTQLTCAAVVFELLNGVAQTEPALAFTTNKITVVSKGAIDLKTEALNFGFRATPNNALKVSTGELLNSFVVVGGTLGKPEVGLDPGKVLLQGGAAIGTAGISLLAKGLLERVGNTTVPLCQSMLADMKSPD